MSSVVYSGKAELLMQSFATLQTGLEESVTELTPLWPSFASKKATMSHL